MFSFFKSKPILKELIPANYIDIHSHLLPGIDDGAKTIDHSKEILENMIGFNFEEVITTPHTIKTVWNNTPETINSAKNKVEKELPDLYKKVTLRAASEYLMDDNFVTLFKSEKLLTLKDNYVLVEMSYLNPPINLYDILFELQLEGYQPVLAHPERYNFYHSNFDEYAKLKKAGCLFQMNLLSSVGYYGKGVTDTADKLLESSLIDFTGSDIHHTNHIKAFENKLKIKSIAPLEKAMLRNSFFKS